MLPLRIRWTGVILLAPYMVQGVVEDEDEMNREKQSSEDVAATAIKMIEEVGAREEASCKRCEGRFPSDGVTASYQKSPVAVI